jgi:hypothetical protein
MLVADANAEPRRPPELAMSRRARLRYEHALAARRTARTSAGGAARRTAAAPAADWPEGTAPPTWSPMALAAMPSPSPSPFPRARTSEVSR